MKLKGILEEYSMMYATQKRLKDAGESEGEMYTTNVKVMALVEQYLLEVM